MSLVVMKHIIVCNRRVASTPPLGWDMEVEDYSGR